MDDVMLRNVQLIQLEIAKEVKRICEQNNISYFMDEVKQIFRSCKA